MNRSNLDYSPQEAAGLDMFVGSGLDFLSEVTFEDLQMVEPGPSDLGTSHLRPEPSSNYAPLAASLGPPGAVLPFNGFGPGYSHNQQQPYADTQGLAKPQQLYPGPGALVHLTYA